MTMAQRSSAGRSRRNLALVFGLLMKEATDILLEGVPGDVNVAALREAILAVEGVVGVHDLHVWALTSGMNAMSGHAVTDGQRPETEVLSAVSDVIRSRFAIHHTTLQLEPRGWEMNETHL